MTKNYRLSAADIVPGLADNSACYATDRITVDGQPVGFMYRDADGWNFFAGDESQSYVDNPANLGMFSLNTIANYDRAIVAYLHAPPGSAYLRRGSEFVVDPEGAPTDPDEPTAAGLSTEYPVVDGPIAMTADWSINLPEPMNRRIDDDMLVLWRPGLTAWIDVWGNPNGDLPTARLAAIKQMSSPHRYDDTEWTDDGLLYSTYRLTEDATRPAALYGNVVGNAGHIQIAVYFDRDSEAAAAAALVGRVSANRPPERATLSGGFA